jgi:hypothetical protein
MEVNPGELPWRSQDHPASSYPSLSLQHSLFRDVECPSKKGQFDRSFNGMAEQAEPTSAAPISADVTINVWFIQRSGAV